MWIGLIGIAVWIGCQSSALTSAKIYLQQKDFDSAEAQLKAAIMQEPQNAYAHFLLGTIYARKGAFEEMNASFEEAVRLDPSKYKQDVERWREQYWVENYNRGVNLAQTHQIPDAVEAFQRAVVIDSTRVDAFRNLGFCYYKLGDADRAISVYERALKVAPEDPDVLTRVGLLLFNEKEYERAIQYLTQASEADPTNVHVLSSLASAYERMKRLDDAVAQYQKAIEVQPTDENLRYNLGVALSEKEDYTGAAQAYEEALKIKPDDKDARFNLAIVYLLKLDDADRALPHLQHMVEHDPENADAWEMLSIAYVKLNRVEEAEEALARSKTLKGE